MKKSYLFLTALLSISLSSFCQCWDKLAIGEHHTITITTDGKLWGYGYNQEGQAGTGSTYYEVLEPTILSNWTGWKDVSANTYHSAAVRSDGTLWVWGHNGNNRLGIGMDALAPVQLGTDTNWDKIAAGYNHTVALRTDGTLWAWGNNSYGQLGTGDYVNQPVPVQMGTATDWVYIDADTDTTIALKADGTLWQWGVGTPTAPAHTPQQIPGTWLAANTGGIATLAIKSDGTLWAWGSNHFGTLGIPEIEGDIIAPVQVGTDTDWVKIATDYHTLAIKADGTLWGWGANASGDVGNGSTENVLSPVKISTDTNWQEIMVGGPTSFAVKQDNTLWAWGGNNNGAYGTGNTEASLVPLQVQCFAAMSTGNAAAVNKLTVAPNPVKDKLQLNFSDSISLKEYALYDMAGRMVLNGKADVREIDLAGLTSGLYLLQLETTSGNYSEKIIKE